MRTEGVAGKATEANAHWAPERISVPKSATNERNLRIPGRSGSAARTRPIAGISPQFEGFRSTTENRGVPGSSPGSRHPQSRAATRSSGFRSGPRTGHGSGHAIACVLKAESGSPVVPGNAETTEHVSRHELGGALRRCAVLRGVRRAAAPFEGSGSNRVHDHSLADAWCSSKASAAVAQHARSLLRQCRRHLPWARQASPHRRPRLRLRPAVPCLPGRGRSGWLTARNTCRESAAWCGADLDRRRVLNRAHVRERAFSDVTGRPRRAPACHPGAVAAGRAGRVSEVL
jgi:hypothetical protein